MGARPEPHDPFAAAFRLQTLRAGVWPSVCVCLYGAIYVALTWEQPHRAAIATLLAAALVASVAIVFLPMERVVRGRWSEPFFVGWSATLVAMIAAACLLDGGADSAFAPLFFLPLVFAALSYPLRAMLLVSATVLGAYLAVAATTGGRSGVHVFLFAAFLTNCAWICSWQARNHDEHRRQLDVASRTDPLTGCLNRRGFQERCAAELARARRDGSEVALVIVDLDDFKGVNDRHGHAAGDEILCWVADRLRGELRTEDPVARLGGDEFACVLGGGRPHVAVERILAALAERAPASAGVAVLGVDGLDADELLHAADAAMYDSKRGRARRTADARRELSWASALASAVDERMAVRHQHSHAVAGYAGAIAERLGWDAEALGELRLAAMLHDVGKIRVPEHILRKPGPLTDDEWVEIARHPVVGEEIVARVEGLQPVGTWIRHSHERIDGGGYPDGLRGEEIPPASRILLVADAFDAMTSDRSYRRAMSTEDAMAELERHAGTQFDATCVEALKAALAVPATA